MVNRDKLGDVRHQLLQLAKRRRAWDVEFTTTRPKDWSPKSVVDPLFNQPFTDQGAKDFIAELLENGHPIEEIALDTPLGKMGYVMKVETEGGKIYIKLELGSGKIIGRSFHYDKR